MHPREQECPPSAPRASHVAASRRCLPALVAVVIDNVDDGHYPYRRPMSATGAFPGKANVGTRRSLTATNSIRLAGLLRRSHFCTAISRRVFIEYRRSE